MSNTTPLPKILNLLVGFLMITLLTESGGAGDKESAEGPITLDRSSDILGPDQNQNGIRDDIEAYIATLAINKAQRGAALQMARALQATLAVDFSNEKALRATSRQLSNAVQCLSIHFPVRERTAMGTRLEAITANTKERTQQYIGFNKALSGSVSRLSSGDTCDPL